MERTKERQLLINENKKIFNDCLKYVEEKWGFTELDIISRRRDARIVEARAYVAKIMYGQTDLSSVKVGVLINRTHATVLHLCGMLEESKKRARHKRKLKDSGVKEDV